MRCIFKNVRKAAIVYQMGKQVMVPYVEKNLDFVFWLLIDSDEESARMAKQDQYRFLLVMDRDGVHGWGINFPEISNATFRRCPPVSCQHLPTPFQCIFLIPKAEKSKEKSLYFSNFFIA